MNKNIKKKHITTTKNDKFHKDVKNQTKSQISKQIKTKDSEDDDVLLHSLDYKKSSKINNDQGLHYATRKVLDKNVNQEGNFILEKFLIDAVNNNQTSPKNSINSDLIKPPLPLPRNEKTITIHNSSNSNSNKDTYSIASSKIDDLNISNDIEKLSIASGDTYNIDGNERKVENFTNDSQEDSTSSGGTYKVCIDKHNIEQINTKKMNSDDSSTIYNNKFVIPIEDIIIHNSPTSKSSVKVVHNNKRKENISRRKVFKKGSPEFKEFEKGIKYHSTTSDDAILECEIIEQSTKRRGKKSSKIPKFKKNFDSESDSTVMNIHAQKSIMESETEESGIKKCNERLKYNDKIESSDEIELQELSIKKKRKSNFEKLNTIDKTESGDSNEKLYFHNDVLGIILYKTDQLLLNSLINQPRVKVHIVDSVTGEYVKRSTDAANVNNDIQNPDYIEPLITKPYSLQENRSLIPQWEELLVFNENINYILEYKNSVIIFFEILDLLTFSAASKNHLTEGANSGWHKVAWAFLKPVGKTGYLNIEKQIRLQLYKPKKYSVKKSPRKCVLYDWWASGSLVKYPSTLHVNIKKVKSEVLKQQSDELHRKLNCDIFDKSNHEEEEHLDKKQYTNREKNYDRTGEIKNKKGWSRITTPSYKIPNKIETCFKSGKKGCMVLKFSNDGSLLACGTADVEKYPIIIYSVDDLKEYCTLSGHQGLIYDLHWSNDDNHLISASADCTVYIWNISTKALRPKQLLPHPSFVYCAQLNSIKSEVITGCYDQIIRIWRSKKIDSDYALMQELDGHLGYVTSLCFEKEGKVFYSSDSEGIVIEWTFNNKDWVLQRSLKFRELQKTVINNIVLHPQAKRLLLFCRDSIHRMVDLNVGCIIQWYRGAINHRVQMYACISPSGDLILAPGEDGSVCIWNTDTGILQASCVPYAALSNDSVIPHCLQYNPQRQAIAVSHHGSAFPILLVVFDKSCTGVELQLRNCADLKEDLLEKRNVVYKNKELKSKSKRKHMNDVKDNDTNVNFEVIIDKINEVLTSARTE